MATLLVLCYGGLLLCLLGTVVAGHWLDNRPALANAIGTTLLAIAPPVVVPLLDGSSAPAIDAAPLLSIWVAGAAFLHTIGMFGPYDTVWWWDHLTHALSASLLAALVYAILLATEPRLALVGSGPLVVAGGTLACTIALGIVWEFLELLARDVGERHGIDPVLEYYGLRDTVLDLVFDAVGALLVITLDIRAFVSVVDDHAAVAGSLLAGSVAAGLLAVGAITLWLERRPERGVR